MKNRMILLSGALMLAVLPASADNNRAVSVEQLPQKARAFISQYFSGEKVAYAKREREFMETKYEVVFTGSAKVEFRGNGEWKEVDCRYAAVPAGIVPAPINAKVQELYPGAVVVGIDRRQAGYRGQVEQPHGAHFRQELPADGYRRLTISAGSISLSTLITKTNR